ncbi:phosphate ABC transporter substrate-binding/OmpA family protein [Pseudaquidulcibacter saccharophilus]|uniref:phosphate ABC transporter substrate-binding/OmpA family protein n=1 Tax=Pseudaquidulcibacter saccharophilus TaxID=2831900 RepID=UPI001EFF5C46|nr:phosphate ABC transporter substrate-binding/OmpA family protein [Pseudaquidulcibacter saccharophilus]
MSEEKNSNQKDIWKTARNSDDIDETFGRRKKPGIFAKMDIFGWISLFLIAVIIGGLGSIGYLSWTFNKAANSKNAEAEGLVPVQGDFAPGRAKKADVLFRLAGRKRVGENLMPDLVVAWMKSSGYGNVGVSKDANVTTISGSKGGKSYRVLLSLGSAKGGFDAMQQGRVEGVYSLRSILPTEADKLSAYGDMTSPDNEKVIGHDVSFVFVNPSNNISTFNGDTLGRILSGEITDWSEISDKKSGEINIRVEEEGGDKNASLLAKLLGDRELRDAAKTYKSANEVIKAVDADKDAIGFAHKDGNTSGVKMVSVNERNARAFEPNSFNISTEAYPFVERILLYIGTTTSNQALEDFAKFTLTSAGQEIVEKDGYGAQKLLEEGFQPPPEAPRDYTEFARNAKRLNFDFRFKMGATNLDNKAIADVTRLQEYMTRQGITQQRIALFGFADNVGSHETNVGVAQARAEKVLSTLGQAGINPSMVRAYGDVLPVGSNAYEEGRIKNRRVEVWVCPPPSCPLVSIVENRPQATQESAQIGVIPTGVHLGKAVKSEGEVAPKG